MNMLCNFFSTAVFKHTATFKHLTIYQTSSDKCHNIRSFAESFIRYYSSTRSKGKIFGISSNIILEVKKNGARMATSKFFFF